MNFASDNTAGMAPAIWEALVPRTGFALGYGQDDLTRRVEQRLSELVRARRGGVTGTDRHRRECTGTGAMAPALGGGALPRRVAHHDRRMRRAGILRRRAEAGRLPGVGCKLTPATLVRTLARYSGARAAPGDPAACRSRRRARPAPSIGRRDRGVGRDRARPWPEVHMDGARLANALARLNASAAEATWKAGVDVLSFGATKGGALAAEAVVLFDQAPAAQYGGAAQAGRAPVFQAPVPGGAISGVPRRRLLAAARAPCQCHG